MNFVFFTSVFCVVFSGLNHQNCYGDGDDNHDQDDDNDNDDNSDCRCLFFRV
jgi:hypothetical protein